MRYCSDLGELIKKDGLSMCDPVLILGSTVHQERSHSVGYNIALRNCGMAKAKDGPIINSRRVLADGDMSASWDFFQFL